MSIPYIQSTLSQVRVVDANISYPFTELGDSATKVYRMTCQQLESSYSSSQVALDTTMTSAAAAGVIELPFSADSSAYFVGDTAHSSSPGGIVQFNRTFANIPASNTSPIGTQVHTYPGVSGFTGTSGARVSLSSISMTLGTPGITIVTSSAHGLNVGDVVYVEYKYTVSPYSTVWTFYNYAKVLAVPSTTQVRVQTGQYYNSQVTLNLVSGNLTLAASRGRKPFTTIATVTEVNSYVLPGVTSGVSTYNDILIQPPFMPINTSTGETVTTITDTTSPTRAEYNEMIRDGDSIILESNLERWLGNIYKQSTKQIKAQ